MKKIGTVLNKVTEVVAIISYVCVAAMVLLNTADVISSKLFKNSISGAYEITEILLMCAIFAAFAYGQTRKTHIHMTLLVNALPGGWKYVPFSLTSLLSSLIAGITTYAAFRQAANIFSRGSVSGILHIPYFPFYYLAAVCMAIYTLDLLYDAIIAVLAIFKEDHREAASGWW